MQYYEFIILLILEPLNEETVSKTRIILKYENHHTDSWNRKKISKSTFFGYFDEEGIVKLRQIKQFGL